MKERLNIKKILFVFIALITFTNVGYASFSVLRETIMSIDTIITDTNKVVKKEISEDYHLRMEKQGFDIESCVCQSCRDGIAVKESKILNSRHSSILYRNAAVLWVIALIVFVVWILDGVACINDVSTCSSNNIPLIFYVSLLMLFGYSSIFYFLKGLSVQNRNKQNLK